MKRAAFLLIFLTVCNLVEAQKHLVFEKEGESIMIQLKPIDGKRFTAKPMDMKNDTIILMVFNAPKARRKLIKESLNQMPYFSNENYFILDSIANASKYSGLVKLPISAVDKIILPITSRPEMKNLYQTLEWSALGFILVGIPIAAASKSLMGFIIFESFGIALSTFGIIIDNKKISPKKWSIKKDEFSFKPIDLIKIRKN
jgi:hypothetical protein